jgi:hypothetical protein
VFLSSPVVQAYSVLTHQALVDSLWDNTIKTVLLQRFPNATEEELRVAHGYELQEHRFGKARADGRHLVEISLELRTRISTHFLRGADREGGGTW